MIHFRNEPAIDMATKLSSCYLFSLLAICVAMICCWADSVSAHPVHEENENQLERVRPGIVSNILSASDVCLKFC